MGAGKYRHALYRHPCFTSCFGFGGAHLDAGVGFGLVDGVAPSASSSTSSIRLASARESTHSPDITRGSWSRTWRRMCSRKSFVFVVVTSASSTVTCSLRRRASHVSPASVAIGAIALRVTRTHAARTRTLMRVSRPPPLATG